MPLFLATFQRDKSGQWRACLFWRFCQLFENVSSVGFCGFLLPVGPSSVDAVVSLN